MSQKEEGMERILQREELEYGDRQLPQKMAAQLCSIGAEQVFRMLDGDGDGQLTWPEYSQWMTAQLTSCSLRFQADSRAGRQTLKCLEIYFYRVAKATGGVVKLRDFPKLLRYTQIFFSVVSI